WLSLVRWTALAACALASTAFSLHHAFNQGRLAYGIALYDDVSYFQDALARQRLWEQGGWSALAHEHCARPPHSPWSTYAALVAYRLFGTTLAAPYFMNSLVVFALLLLVQQVLSEAAALTRWLATALVLVFPLTACLAEDYRPDGLCAVVSAAGLWLIATTRLATASWWRVLG